jgi:hypothetical protein
MIKGLYETHLFVESLERSIDFYKNPSPRFVSARTGLELNVKKLARGDTSHGER